VILLSIYNKEECRIRIPILGWEHVSKHVSKHFSKYVSKHVSKHVSKLPRRKEDECRRKLRTRKFGNTAVDAWWLSDPLQSKYSMDIYGRDLKWAMAVCSGNFPSSLYIIILF
jgi:hypothetical protein